eukprot:TRINITY_DN40586_c0_g1_i1.p1 TRINITY_DN40586_c0_g1~~TRINITY_DN40586_c0_g1_i1.p1  ORF type:complete len:252 (+),score=54.07 TRINITY_DN40586_c0_g1_i1:77-832(+)
MVMSPDRGHAEMKQYSQRLSRRWSFFIAILAMMMITGRWLRAFLGPTPIQAKGQRRVFRNLRSFSLHKLRATSSDSAERVLDAEALEALLAGDSAEDEEQGWEDMVDRIQFEGGIPTASDFRAPSPTVSAYSKEKGFLEMEARDLLSILKTQGDEGVEVWDVRTAEEYLLGHIPEAINVPFSDLAEAATKRQSNDEAKLQRRLCLICASGSRSAQAQVRLTKVYNISGVYTLRGGLCSWELLGGSMTSEAK